MALLMLGLWVLQRRWNDATIVDVAWSGGVGGMALGLAYFSDGAIANRVILALVAGIWSLRLFIYLLLNRVVKRTGEDGRYRALREKWKEKASLYFLLFFQFQALLVVLFAIPFVPVAQNSLSLWSPWHIAGLSIATIAIGGEALADAQLAQWRSNSANKGKTCRQGLWNYSRHPNYFFEWIHWWSYVFLAQGSPIWWIALWGPIIMWIFLFRVTGIPYTEEQALRSRSDYALYQKTVSVFVPWFPRRPPDAAA